MFTYLRLPVSWFEILKRTVNAVIADNVLGMAAQLAFYFFLSLFPALLFLVALLSFLPIQNVMDQLLAYLAEFAPQDVLDIIKEQLEDIAEGGRGGLLTIGFVGALWSSSLAMVAIIDTLNRAYNIQESRPIWTVRAMAIALTMMLAIFIVISITLVLLGPLMAEWMAAWFGFGRAFELTWKIAQWPLVFFLVSSGIGLIYFFAPDAEQEWVWITPGSLIATVLWILSSLGFRFYLANFGDYQETYGTIGGIVVLMLWFWLTGVAILVGAELNSEIEHASPYGKDPGEKNVGEKKKIGALAARAFDEHHRGEALETVPVTDEGNCDIDRMRLRPRAGEGQDVRPSTVLIGTIAMIPVALWGGWRIRQRLDQ
jgi:membrane protein